MAPAQSTLSVLPLEVRLMISKLAMGKKVYYYQEKNEERRAGMLGKLNLFRVSHAVYRDASEAVEITRVRVFASREIGKLQRLQTRLGGWMKSVQVVCIAYGEKEGEMMSKEPGTLAVVLWGVKSFIEAMPALKTIDIELGKAIDGGLMREWVFLALGEVLLCLDGRFGTLVKRRRDSGWVSPFFRLEVNQAEPGEDKMVVAAAATADDDAE